MKDSTSIKSFHLRMARPASRKQQMSCETRGTGELATSQASLKDSFKSTLPNKAPRRKSLLGMLR